MVRLVEAFRLLARRPELGHGREDLPAPSLRFWPVGLYLVIYLVEKLPIEIVAVVHGARDVPRLVNPRRNDLAAKSFYGPSEMDCRDAAYPGQRSAQPGSLNAES